MKLESRIFQATFMISSYSIFFETAAFVTVPPRNSHSTNRPRSEDIGKTTLIPKFENVTDGSEVGDRAAAISESNRVPTHDDALTPTLHKTRFADLMLRSRNRTPRSEPRFRDFVDEYSSRNGGGLLPGNVSFPATYMSELKEEPKPKKIVCYYDRTKSYAGILDMNVADLNASMSLCTHLVYGYAMVDGDSGRISLSHAGMHQLVEIQHIQMIHALRSFYPGFKILLGIGAPPSEHTATDNYSHFNKVLKSDENQMRFINSVLPILQRYEFDGIDLLWKFERGGAKDDSMPVKNEDCGFFCKLWNGVSGAFEKTERQDSHVLELRHKFTKFVKGLKTSLYNYTMAVSVLPEMHSVFYDKTAINYYADQIHLLTFDFLTPWNRLGLAEQTAPLSKVDRMVNDWLWEDAQKNKLVVGVATYARTWKIHTGELYRTSPPVVAEGIGPMGSYTKRDGFLSFYEVCIQMAEDGFTSAELLLTKAEEAEKLEPVTFAYRLQSNFSDGLWVSFDDPTAMAIKAKYVNENNLAGVIVHGLVFDDFKGMCAHKYKNKFPLLRSIKENIE